MITLLCPPMLGLWGWLNSDEVSSVWRFTGANLAHIRSKLSRLSSRYGWQPRSWLINCETFWTVTHSFSPSSHLEAMATVCYEQSSEPLFIVIRKSPSLYSDRIFLFSATKDIREWAGEVKLFFFCPFSGQALHRPPPVPVKEHRVSPTREESLSGHLNEEPSQNVGAAGVPHGTVGSGASNKKPRLRTKVQWGYTLFPLAKRVNGIQLEIWLLFV